MDPRALGEVPDIALLARHGEDVAPRLEERPGALGGDLIGADHGGRVLPPWPCVAPVHSNVDLEPTLAAFGDVIHVESARLLEDDGVLAGARGLDVIVPEVGELLDRSVWAVPEQVHRPCAI